MTPDTDVDVVVIGFGVAGATAALSAAGAGARVLVLDQGTASRRGEPGRRDEPRRRELGRLRAAALAAGITLRAPCRAHELRTEGGRVCGVGYAALPPGGLAARAHRFLRWVSDRTRLAGPGRAADSLWAARFVVDEVRCPAVILAMDPRHWDFVSAATWSATCAAARDPAARAAGWLGRPGPAWPAAGQAGPATPELPTPELPTPELAARRWLAKGAATRPAAQPAELLVDPMTGAVLVTAGQVVPGLYSAVPRPACPGGAASAASRAGYGAVITAPPWPLQDLSFALSFER
jgi:hypothetical protein